MGKLKDMFKDVDFEAPLMDVLKAVGRDKCECGGQLIEEVDEVERSTIKCSKCGDEKMGCLGE